MMKIQSGNNDTILVVTIIDQVWDDELARVAQKWADQCADVDYLVSRQFSIMIRSK